MTRADPQVGGRTVGNLYVASDEIRDSLSHQSLGLVAHLLLVGPQIGPNGASMMVHPRFRRLISRSLPAAFAVAVLSVVMPAHASLIALESFDYGPAGSDLAGKSGGTGFSGAWTSGAFNTGNSANYDIASSSPLTATAGAYVAATTSFSGLTRNLASALSGDGSVYFMSFLLRPDGPASASSFFGLTLGDTRFANEAFVGKPGGGASSQYVLEDRGGVGQVSSGVGVVADDVTLLVLKLVFGSTSSEFSLYVDPVAGAGEPATANAVKTNGLLNRVSYLGLYSSGNHSIDEIRIGTTFADVVPAAQAVPEPSSPALLAMAVLCAWLSVAGRRRDVTRLPPRA